MRVRTTSAAELDVVNAALNYDLRRLGLGAAFMDEVERVVVTIEQGPRTFPRLQIEGVDLPNNLRFARTKRFPFLVIFRESTEEIEISAVKHAHSDLESFLKKG